MQSVLEYRQVYIEWLCLAKDLFGESSNNYDDEERNSEPNHEMEDVVIDGGQDDGGGQDDDGGGRDSFLSDKQFIPGARSELSGTFLAFRFYVYLYANAFVYGSDSDRKYRRSATSL